MRKQGKKQLFHAELMQAAEAIVTREGVEGLLSYTVQALMTTRQVRAYRGRPARQETEVSFEIEVQRDEALIEEKKREMGWQVYGDERRGDERCRRWCGRTGGSIGSRTTGRG